MNTNESHNANIELEVIDMIRRSTNQMRHSLEAVVDCEGIRLEIRQTIINLRGAHDEINKLLDNLIVLIVSESDQ